MAIKSKTIDVKFDGEKGRIVGYASTWTREPDSYGDIVKQGAFVESLKAIADEGRVLPFLFNHDGANLNAYIGKVVEMEEDDHGLKFEAEFDETPEAQRARDLAKDGRLCKFSFAYDVLEQGTVKLEDGREANELRKLNIHEISLVLYPANPDTSVIEVKAGRRNSAKDETSLSRVKELAGEIESIINSLLADDDRDDEAEVNAEEADTPNAEEQKARVDSLLKEANDILAKEATKK